MGEISDLRNNTYEYVQMDLSVGRILCTYVYSYILIPVKRLNIICHVQ